LRQEDRASIKKIKVLRKRCKTSSIGKEIKEKGNITTINTYIIQPSFAALTPT
jgi:hypothetical protein